MWTREEPTGNVSWLGLRVCDGYCHEDSTINTANNVILLLYLPETSFRTTEFTPLSCSVKRTQSVCIFTVSEVETLVHQRIIFSIRSKILLQNLLYIPGQQNSQNIVF